MTIDTEKNKSILQTYTGLVATQYTYDFQIPSTADLKVYIIDNSGDGPDRTLLTLDTHYTVTDNGTSGYIQIVSPAGINFITALSYTTPSVAIYREIDELLQSSDFSNQGAFLPANIEAAFDFLTYSLQQHEEQLRRCIQIDPWDTTISGLSLTDEQQLQAATLPKLVNGGVIYFNSSNSSFEISGDVTVTQLATVAGISSDITTVASNIADINLLADDLEGGGNNYIQTVATNIGDVTTVAGISGNVTTVAGISGNVTTVAGINGAVSTVAGISGAVSTVAGISGAVSTVAGIDTAVSAVAADEADIGIVAANIDAINDFVDQADAFALTRHDDAAALRAYYATTARSIVGEPYAIIDGAAGATEPRLLYKWKPAATATDDGYKTILPTGVGSGRFVLVGSFGDEYANVTSAAMEFLNLLPGILQYETSGGALGVDSSIVSGCVGDADALNIKRLIVSYAEYLGYWFWEPTINYKAGSIQLNISAVDGNGQVTVTDNAAGGTFFSAGDVGSLLIKYDNTGPTLNRIYITNFIDADTVKGVILSNSTNPAFDLTDATLVDAAGIVPGVTSLPADSLSSSAGVASSSWTASSWELRKYYYDYDVNAFGVYWYHAARVLSPSATVTDFDTIQVALDACASDQSIVIGLGRSGDTPLMNDLVNYKDAPTTDAARSAYPGANVAITATALHSWNSTVLTDATGSEVYVWPNLNSFSVGQHVIEATGVGTGRAFVKKALTDTQAFPYLVSSGTFQVGETITGGTSGSTANVVEVGTSGGINYLIVDTISAGFTNGETLTGGTSTATGLLSLQQSTYLVDILAPFASSPVASGDWLLRNGLSNPSFRLGVSVEDRLAEAITREQEKAADLDSQYGGDANFGGFYISHEPQHIKICGDDYVDPLITGDATHTDPINARVSGNEVIWWAPAGPLDLNDYWQRRQVKTIAKGATTEIEFEEAHYYRPGMKLVARHFTGDWTSLNNVEFYVADVISSTKIEILTSYPSGSYDTSGLNAYVKADDAGFFYVAADYLGERIDATGVTHIATQGSSGYGKDYETGNQTYINGFSELKWQLDEHFAAWRSVIDQATNVTLVGNVELWQIEGTYSNDNSGAALPARPAFAERVRAEAKIISPYVDEIELYALMSYAESGTADYRLREDNAGKPNYRTRAHALYSSLLKSPLEKE